VASGAVIVRATSKGHIGSRIAGALAKSPELNHCMLIDGRRVYEAVPWYGVRVVPERIAMRGVRRYQDRIAVIPDIAAMRAFLEDQLGAGYDWPGAAGLPLLRSADWQDPARWWCWELAIAGLGAGSLWLVDPAKASGCTPHHILNSSLPKTEVFHQRANR
jgi:hypothetical protein